MGGPYRLQHFPIHVTIGGEYCVTRAVTGTENEVQQELEQLKARSGLYLSLGHGKKITASSIRQLDARHRHALMTVVNDKSFDILLEIEKRLGLEFDRIEPSLVSICRLIGQGGYDQKDPIIFVNMGDYGGQIGIRSKVICYLTTGQLAGSRVIKLVR